MKLTEYEYATILALSQITNAKFRQIKFLNLMKEIGYFAEVDVNLHMEEILYKAKIHS